MEADCGIGVTNTNVSSFQHPFAPLTKQMGRGIRTRWSGKRPLVS